MTSPIEDFAVGGIARDLATRENHTEYGGAPGVYQPELAPDGSEGHTLDASEVANGMVRAGQTVTRGIGGIGIDPGIVVDPVSGREIKEDAHTNVEGDGGQFSDLLGT